MASCWSNPGKLKRDFACIPLQPLLVELHHLIDAARHGVVTAANAELTHLYRRIGRRIRVEPLRGKRDEYGKHMVVELMWQLTPDFCSEWSEHQLRYRLRLAKTFPDE